MSLSYRRIIFAYLYKSINVKEANLEIKLALVISSFLKQFDFSFHSNA
jgi:hypothetical protein